MWYLSFKALHLIGVVVWFSGLFYIGRLFVYHQELNDRPEEERRILKAQFELMEKRLWYAITIPGMSVTLVAGLALLYFLGFPSWIHAKLFLIVILLGYHGICGKLRKQLSQGTCSWSGKQLRLFNEVPSLLLVSIVFAVVLKHQLSWPIFLVVLAGVGGVIGGSVQWYANIRKRRASQPSA